MPLHIALHHRHYGRRSVRLSITNAKVAFRRVGLLWSKATAQVPLRAMKKKPSSRSPVRVSLLVQTPVVL